VANIEKIGDVTKYNNGGQFLYLFPSCNLSVNNNILDFRFYNLHRQRVAFEEIQDKYATTTAEELADYYAANGFFSIPTGSGGGGVTDVDIVADSVGLNKEVTQALVLAELQSIDTKDFATQTTLAAIQSLLQQSDERLGTSMVESTFQMQTLEALNSIDENIKLLIYLIKSLNE
jgi:tRNA/tmRNA/rRNA uracil-C5-methylase (TrmA/RlmC/RlmD family)